MGEKKPAVARTNDKKFDSVAILEAWLLRGKDFVVDS